MRKAWEELTCNPKKKILCLPNLKKSPLGNYLLRNLIHPRPLENMTKGIIL